MTRLLALLVLLVTGCVPAPTPVPTPTPTPAPVISSVWHPTRQQVMTVKMNFGSYQFDDGSPILEWFMPNMNQSQLGQLWARVAGGGDTHFLIAIHVSYPNYEVPQSTLTPQQLHDVIVDLRDNHHLIPVVMLSSGDGGTGTDPDAVWPAYFAALGDVQDDAIWCLGFEVGANAGWSSNQILHGVHVLRQWLGPQGVIAYESIPERWTGASNPVEPDDPSGGNEPGWWTLPDAQQIDLFFYESSHGSKLLEQPCDVNDPGCWLNRWQEGVQRLGIGGHGWPKKPIVAFELGTYDCFQNHATCGAYSRLTAAAMQVCTDNGITCGYGSGRPQ